MKIGKTPEQQQAAAVVADKARTATVATPATSSTTSDDPSAKVALSTTATSLIGNGSSADFDADKVASVTQSIDRGTYKINPHVIADKLLANARELLTKASQ